MSPENPLTPDPAPAPSGATVASPETPTSPEAGGAGRRTPSSDAEDGRGGRSRRSAGRWILEAAVIIALALVVTVVLRTFVAQTFYIPSGSMEPTLQIGDRILVNKLAYRLHGIGRADVIVFARPPLEEAACAPPPVNDLVKRVIGLPGETVSLSGGQVDIDGHPLSEPWLPKGTVTAPGPGNAPYNLSHPYTVPAGDYYLMGDNRGASCDSRYWGPIPRSLIVGKVDALIWPLSHVKFFF